MQHSAFFSVAIAVVLLREASGVNAGSYGHSPRDSNRDGGFGAERNNTSESQDDRRPRAFRRRFVSEGIGFAETRYTTVDSRNKYDVIEKELEEVVKAASPTDNWKRGDKYRKRQDGIQLESPISPDLCSGQTEFNDNVIRAAVMLPHSSLDYELTLSKVLPVLELAAEIVKTRGILHRNISFQFLASDDRCDAVYAQLRTFEAIQQNVHVFFGPTCEYCVGKYKLYLFRFN